MIQEHRVVRSILMLTWPLVASVICPWSSVSASSEPIVGPDTKTILSIPEVADPKISPDGAAVVFSMRRADWENNRYDTELYIVHGDEDPVQLTNNEQGSSTNPKWAPDGRSVAFFADGEDGMQIYVVSINGGKPKRLTNIPGGLFDYEWSPSGKTMALLLGAAPDPKIAARAEIYGDFEIVGEEKPATYLWLLDIETALAKGGVGYGDEGFRPLTSAQEFSVNVFSVEGLLPSFSFSPDERFIAFAYAKSPLVLDAIHSNIGVVDIATGEVTKLVDDYNTWDETPIFSSDGASILFSRTVTTDWLADRLVMRVPVNGGVPTAFNIKTNALRDGQPSLLGVSNQGVDLFFQEGTERGVYNLTPESGALTPAIISPVYVAEASFSNDGKSAAFVGYNGATPPEVYRIDIGKTAKQLTKIGAAMANWPKHKAELVQWTASDGVKIEGVLYTPAQVEEKQSAPLIIVLHGGPREAASPRRLHDQEYPVEHWLSKGARVLFPNYRGSIGYGEKFRKLTWRNIGKAERIDILSAVNSFKRRRLISENQVAVAGHSWGGYLSAFVSASTDVFTAASVGSGITDHQINYVLSMAGVAKEGYLNSLPWEEPSLWRGASPITYVTRAKTPTLIQHGENDWIVPVANAIEFHRGLADMNVPTKFALFKNMEHQPSTPKQKLGWMVQNETWFDRYLWGEDVSAVP